LLPRVQQARQVIILFFGRFEERQIPNLQGFRPLVPEQY